MRPLMPAFRLVQSGSKLMLRARRNLRADTRSCSRKMPGRRYGGEMLADGQVIGIRHRGTEFLDEPQQLVRSQSA